jgi:hypothetical protein
LLNSDARKIGAPVSAMLGEIMSYDPRGSSHMYPKPLEELIGYFEADDYRISKEVVLVFRDKEGGQVTFRLLHKEIGSLVRTLGSPPKKAQET